MSQLKVLSAFVSHHRGIQLSNRYKVILPPLRGFKDDLIAMDMLCRKVTFPGRTLDTIDRKVNHLSVKIPTGYTNDQVSMEFTETNDNIIGRYFDNWIAQSTDQETGLTSYRDDIARTVTILKVDKKGVPTYGVMLKKAFPIIKSSVDLSDESDSIVTQRVSFEYQDFEIIDTRIEYRFGPENHSVDSLIKNFINAAKDEANALIYKGTEKIVSAAKNSILRNF